MLVRSELEKNLGFESVADKPKIKAQVRVKEFAEMIGSHERRPIRGYWISSGLINQDHQSEGWGKVIKMRELHSETGKSRGRLAPITSLPTSNLFPKEKELLERIVLTLREDDLHEVNDVLTGVPETLRDEAIDMTSTVFQGKIGAVSVFTDGRVISVIAEKKTPISKVIFIA